MVSLGKKSMHRLLLFEFETHNWLTLPKTNIVPEMDGWKMKFPIGKAYFQGIYMLVSGRVCLVMYPKSQMFQAPLGIIHMFRRLFFQEGGTLMNTVFPPSLNENMIKMRV